VTSHNKLRDYDSPLIILNVSAAGKIYGLFACSVYHKVLQNMPYWLNCI